MAAAGAKTGTGMLCPYKDETPVRGRAKARPYKAAGLEQVLETIGGAVAPTDASVGNKDDTT